MNILQGLHWVAHYRPLAMGVGYRHNGALIWSKSYCCIAESGLHGLRSQRTSRQKLSQWSGSLRASPSCARGNAPEVEDIEKYSEALEFFRGQMDQLKKPLSRSLLRRLDMDIWHGVAVDKPGTKGIVFQFFEKVKKEYPKNIVLVKVGEFYECWGFDAVILVEHAGLNPMGREGVPRAGTPIKNLRRTLTDLVEGSGFSCVVCEEMPEAYQYGKRSSPKTRFIGGVVTPASPMYTYNMVEDNPESDDLGGYKYLDGKMEGMNIIGLSIGVRGLNLMEVCLDLRHVFTIDGLHHDAVISRLLAGGFSPPLYLHSSFQAYPDLKRQVLAAASHSGAAGANVTKFDGADPIQALVQAVRHDHMIGGRMEFEVVERSNVDRPLPLFLSAAKQLGLARSEGTPSLSESILPADAPRICQNFLHRLLLHPTPQSISLSTQNIIRYMISENCCGIASMSPLSGAKIARFIDDEEASAHLLSDTALMCRALSNFIQGASRGESADENPAVHVSRVAAFEIGAGSTIAPEILAQKVYHVYEKISHTVLVEQNSISDYPMAHTAVLDKSSVFLEDEAPFQTPSRDYFTSNEENWRGIVSPNCSKNVQMAYREVDRTALLLQASLFRDFQAAIDASQGILDTIREKRDPVSVVYDINNNAIWLKIGSAKILDILHNLKGQSEHLSRFKFPLLYKSLDSVAEFYVNESEKYKNMTAEEVVRSWIEEIESQEILFEHPFDRNGVIEKKRLSTVGVEKALNAYRAACAAAHSIVSSQALRRIIATIGSC